MLERTDCILVVLRILRVIFDASAGASCAHSGGRCQWVTRSITRYVWGVSRTRISRGWSEAEVDRTCGKTDYKRGSMKLRACCLWSRGSMHFDDGQDGVLGWY